MAERHDEQLLGFATLDKIFPIIDTVDSLDSDVRVRPLAARQGKVLREMIEAIQSFTIEIVDSLPGVGKSGIMYLVLDPLSTEDNNKYNEFVWIATTNSYEKLGSFTTKIDLSGYATVEQLNNALQRYQEKLVSGTNIKTINNQTVLGSGNLDIKSGDTLPTDGTTGQVLTKTEDGYAWQDAQAGDVFPEGGTTGQVLKKTADGVEWGNDEKGFELPSGGSVGQVLKKTASGTEWANDNDTTYQNATQSKAGLMSAEDKTKLDTLSSAYISILTQDEYNELSPKEEGRIYFIKG